MQKALVSGTTSLKVNIVNPANDSSPLRRNDAVSRNCRLSPLASILSPQSGSSNPYWDNSLGTASLVRIDLDSQAPERSLLWQFLGGNGNPDADQGDGEIEYVDKDGDTTSFGYCVTDGPFADVRLLYSRRGNAGLTNERDCLRRQFGTDYESDASICSPEIVDMISRERDYTVLNSGLETQYHGLVHVWMGGDMAVCSLSIQLLLGSD